MPDKFEITTPSADAAGGKVMRGSGSGVRNTHAVIGTDEEFQRLKRAEELEAELAWIRPTFHEYSSRRLRVKTGAPAQRPLIERGEWKRGRWEGE
jgi:hypothetical protein